MKNKGEPLEEKLTSNLSQEAIISLNVYIFTIIIIYFLLFRKMQRCRKSEGGGGKGGKTHQFHLWKKLNEGRNEVHKGRKVVFVAVSLTYPKYSMLLFNNV